MMDVVLGYFAGLLTLINPCVLPVLPIVLASALQSHPWGPAALAAGMSLAFVALGVTVAAVGQSLGLREDHVIQAAAALMIGFGLVMLVPRLNRGFALATGGVAERADAGMTQVAGLGLRGQFLCGMLLGAVWSPCVGPTLGGAISLASQGKDLFWAAAIMAGFAAGISTIILALGYGARGFVTRNRGLMRRIAEVSKLVMGVIFVGVGLMIFFQIHQVIEAWLLDVMPIWLQDFSVSL